MAKKDNLTVKQRMFVEEYLIDLNATQAAIRQVIQQKQQISKVQGCWQMSRFNRLLLKEWLNGQNVPE